MNERKKGAREDETVCPGCEKGYTFPVFRLDRPDFFTFYVILPT
jgi:hypothetical protein